MLVSRVRGLTLVEGVWPFEDAYEIARDADATHVLGSWNKREYGLWKFLPLSAVHSWHLA